LLNLRQKWHEGSTPSPSAMKKADLEYLRKNAATGEVFNQQLITTQVETIYSLNKLRKQLSKLNKSIDNSSRKSEELENSNQRLQIAMFCLTLFTTVMTVFPISKAIFEEIGVSGLKLIYSSSITTSVITVLISIFIGKQIKKWG
jgi:hypothetical protein